MAAKESTTRDNAVAQPGTSPQNRGSDGVPLLKAPDGAGFFKIGTNLLREKNSTSTVQAKRAKHCTSQAVPQADNLVKAAIFNSTLADSPLHVLDQSTSSQALFLPGATNRWRQRRGNHKQLTNSKRTASPNFKQPWDASRHT